MINPIKSELEKVEKALQRLSTKGSEKNYIVTKGEIHQIPSIAFEILANNYFDIEGFYSVIKKHLELKVVEHAKLYASISRQQLDIIFHARKALLFSQDKP